ncbi:MAG: hypothetical protein J6J93_03995 [Muribaculaceae bacterium]|nr:hypothetical protein [Muribaculaceae bacterium]
MTRDYTYDVHGWPVKIVTGIPMKLAWGATETTDISTPYYGAASSDVIKTPCGVVVARTKYTETIHYADGAVPRYNGTPSARDLTQGGRYDYRYDALDWLVAADYTAPSGKPDTDFSTEYTYDILSRPTSIKRHCVVDVDGTDEVFGLLDNLTLTYGGATLGTVKSIITGLWDSWDIHAADYAMWSPWMYCGGNPIRFVDPTGKKWDDPKQAEKLKKNIEKKISSTKDKISEQNQEMAKNKASGKDYSKQENKIADLNERITNLEKSKSDIDLLGKDSNIYKFRKVSGDGAHYVELGKDGKIIIETSEDAFSVHEIGHVRQSLESGGLEFNDSGYLINSGTRESPGKQYDAISKAEIEAYQIQYSYRPGSLPKRVRNIFEIDVHYVGSIMNPDGSVGYPVIRDYSNYLKNLPQNAE